MDKYKIPAIILLSLFFAGCGTMKRNKSVPQASVTPSEVLEPPRKKEKVILYPHDYEGIEDSDAEYADGSDQSPERCDIVFSPSECEHVRIKGINPLPADGKLELDLDRMKSDFCFPYEGKFISNYGPRGRSMHTGVDIKTVPNDTIRAAFPGVVRMSKPYSGYGNIIVIQHYYGFETLYAHCSRNLVAVNDVVEAGTPIGLGGRTGRATTEHLHFEVRAACEHIDPNKLLDMNNLTLRSGKLTIENSAGKIIAYNTDSERLGIEEKERALALSRQEAQDAAQASAVKTADRKPASSGGSEAQYHKVQKGETLYALARKYSTSVKKICELNNLKESTLLQINQRLRVK